MVFTTDRVAYVSSRSLLHTDDRVEFSDGNLNVEGVGMELMVNTRILKINKQVTASYGGGALTP
jgi:lipopolysaccharide export system protein LptC